MFNHKEPASPDLITSETRHFILLNGKLPFLLQYLFSYLLMLVGLTKAYKEVAKKKYRMRLDALEVFALYYLGCRGPDFLPLQTPKFLLYSVNLQLCAIPVRLTKTEKCCHYLVRRD